LDVSNDIFQSTKMQPKIKPLHKSQ
jgi:hypothetical protein